MANAYDVFLSFRGKDTRKTFTDHLYRALARRDIRTFRDQEALKAGERIDMVFEAIKASRISIPIFSKLYADSSWCLMEITCIANNEGMILPVFYDVEPSDVRRQRGTFSEAFEKHEERYDDEVIGKWRKALMDTSLISGYDVRNMAGGYEGLVVDEIVKRVLDILADEDTRTAKEEKMVLFMKLVLSELDDTDTDEETEEKIVMIVKAIVREETVEDLDVETLQKLVELIKSIWRVRTGTEIGGEEEAKIRLVVNKVSIDLSREAEERKLVLLTKHVLRQLAALEDQTSEEMKSKFIEIVRSAMRRPPEEENDETIEEKLSLLVQRVLSELTPEEPESDEETEDAVRLLNLIMALSDESNDAADQESDEETEDDNLQQIQQSLILATFSALTLSDSDDD